MQHSKFNNEILKQNSQQLFKVNRNKVSNNTSVPKTLLYKNTHKQQIIQQAKLIPSISKELLISQAQELSNAQLQMQIQSKQIVDAHLQSIEQIKELNKIKDLTLKLTSELNIATINTEKYVTMKAEELTKFQAIELEKMKAEELIKFQAIELEKMKAEEMTKTLSAELAIVKADEIDKTQKLIHIQESSYVNMQKLELKNKTKTIANNELITLINSCVNIQDYKNVMNSQKDIQDFLNKLLEDMKKNTYNPSIHSKKIL